jgi:DNA-binding winged helix-turn-helix (wHTH) protein
MSPKRSFIFDRYRLDEQERQLLLGTQVVPLPPRLFDLLALLVRNAGRLLPKQDLLDRVWSDVAVEEGSLTRSISSLRRALGSTADGQDYIQTVSKRGYRFIANVRETTDDDLEGTRLAGRIPLPPSLLATAEVDFVGREAELVQMQDVWQRAKGGRYQLLLVAGEPGIGKTRLSLEFARSRGAEGSTVLVGRSDEENLVPYQPFVESLTWYVRHCPEADLRAQLGAIGGGTELAAFVTRLHASLSRDRRWPMTSLIPSDNPRSPLSMVLPLIAPILAIAPVAGSIMTDVTLIGVSKIPFACSYLPGKSNVQFMFWVFVIVFIPLAMMFSHYEQSVLDRPRAYAALLAILLVAALILWLFNRFRAKSAVLYYEESEPEVITMIGIGSWQPINQEVSAQNH